MGILGELYSLEKNYFESLIVILRYINPSVWALSRADLKMRLSIDHQSKNKISLSFVRH